MNRRLPLVISILTMGAAALSFAQGPGQTLELDLEGATLDEALAEAAGLSPELQYVVWRGDRARTQGRYRASNVHDLVDQIAEDCGAEATVVGDLWIIQGAPPDAWRVDLRAAVAEAVEPYPAIREALQRRQGDPAPAGSLGDLYRAVVPDATALDGIGPGMCRCIPITIDPGSAAYAELEAALIECFVQQCMAATPLDATQYSIAIRGDALLAVPDGRPRGSRTLALDLAKNGLDPLGSIGIMEGTGRGGCGWSATSLLSRRVSLACRAPLSEVLSDLARTSGVDLALVGPELDGAVSLRVSELPIGVVLVALSAASALPADDLEAHGRAGFGDADSHSLGGASGIRHWYARQPIDQRIAPYLATEAEAASAIADLTDAERDALRLEPVPTTRLAPRIRHTIWRWLLDARERFGNPVDYLMEELGRPLRIFVFVSSEGDATVSVWRQRGTRSLMHVGRITETGVERERGVLLSEAHGPSRHTRLTHAYGLGPRDLATELWREGDRWTRLVGPMALPAPEGR